MFKITFFAILLCFSSLQPLSSVEPKTYVTDGYDVHTYFHTEDTEKAHKVYQDFLNYLHDNGVQVGHSGFYPQTFENSPHPIPMWEVDFKPQDRLAENLGIAISWLMLNRDGLSVLVHPNTENHSRESKVRDHTIYTLWMGTPVNLNVDPSIFDDESH